MTSMMPQGRFGRKGSGQDRGSDLSMSTPLSIDMPGLSIIPRPEYGTVAQIDFPTTQAQLDASQDAKSAWIYSGFFPIKPINVP